MKADVKADMKADASPPPEPYDAPETGARSYVSEGRGSHLEEQYPAWVRNNRFRDTDAPRLLARASGFGYRPLLSLLLPVRDPDHHRLRRTLDSVLGQVYPHWELCIPVDDSMVDPTRKLLDLYEHLDARVRSVRADAGAGGLDDALPVCDGELVGLLGQDDALSPDALYRVVEMLQEHPDADLVYTDEDRVDDEGERSHPHFKPGWSPDFLLSRNYLSRLCVYRRRLLDEAGGFGDGAGGNHDHDLALRLTESSREILHLPRILYHRGLSPDSDTHRESAREASRRAISGALERRGIEGRVEDGLTPDSFRVRRRIAGAPKVSIVVPSRNNASLLANCVESIEKLTTYTSYEIIIVDNRNTDADAVEYLASTPHSVVPFAGEFNFSEINNLAAARTDGDYLLFLNDDTEVISGGWLEAMLSHAGRGEVGAVGARLLYPDGRIQHAGVLLGVGSPWGPGVATHSHQYYAPDSAGHGGSLAAERNYGAVTAACMMVRRTVFEEAGGFDESLRVSFNDVDLCLKIRERGYSIVYTPFAELYHHESVSRGTKSNPAEIASMRARWGPVLDTDPYYNPNFSRGAGDYRLRADMLRPRALRPATVGTGGETGEETVKHPREMEPEERRLYVDVQQARARSLPNTGLVSAGDGEAPADHPEARLRENRHDTRPVEPGERDEDVQPVVFFIVGQPKSGTSWVRATLDSHPEIACLGEGKFFGRDFKRENPSSGGELPSLHSLFADSEDLRTWARAVGPWISRDSDPETRRRELERHTGGLARAAISYFLEEERGKSGKRIIGDKTPAHTAYLEEIHDLFPEARILHVVRDGRDQAVSSVFHWWKESDKAHFASLPRNVLRIKEEYFEDRESFGAEGRSIFDEDALRGLARGWKENVSRARELGPRLFGDQYFELRYEDLLIRPERLFGEIMEFLGADSETELVARCVRRNSFERMTRDRQRGVEAPGSFYRKGIAGDWKNYFTQRDRRAFEEEAGELLDRFGYERA